MVESLAPEPFSALLAVRYGFLTTAEALHTGSGFVADQLGAGAIAIEYAKIVETELRSA